MFYGEEMPISKSTERIWKRLNRDLTGKPSYRANKTGSSRRFIPKERCTNPDTFSFITELLPSEDKVPLRNTIYTLSCVLLDLSLIHISGQQDFSLSRRQKAPSAF